MPDGAAMVGQRGSGVRCVATQKRKNENVTFSLLLFKRKAGAKKTRARAGHGRRQQLATAPPHAPSTASAALEGSERHRTSFFSARDTVHPMFYSTQILAKKGPLGTIWIASHLERRLKRSQVFDADIGASVGEWS